MVTYVVGHSPDRVAIIRSVRDKHLGAAARPASTMVGVAALNHPDMLIEIEAIAALD
jgi:2-iminobutanoate/2-iminopropanoate deaminase